MNSTLASVRAGPRPCRHRLGGAVLALATALATLFATVVATAPTAAAQEDPAIARARQQLEQAQAEANAAHDRYEKAVTERDEAQAQIAALEEAIPALRAREVELREQLSTRAAALYKNTGPGAGLDVLTAKDRMQAGRKTKLTEAADDFDDERARQLLETAERLQKVQVELEDRRAELDGLVATLEREKAVFEQKVAAANRALEVAEEIGALRALGEPVMGDPVLSAAELVAWYRSTGSSPRLSGGTTIEQLSEIFIQEGLAENVRGDVAFAQSYIETGGFRAGGSDNNFSGLGACDGCSGERRFPSALDGVRAQIQHLRNYADRRSGTATTRAWLRGISTRSLPRGGRRRGR
jgi:peptidoglycan hydrolase CwlO-like protein